MIHCGKVPRFTIAVNILPISFFCLNLWKFENCQEIAWNYAQIIDSVFVAEKTQFGSPRQILALLQSLQDFAYIALQGLLSVIFVHLKSRHIGSKWFETLQKSPNHWILLRKTKFDLWWYSSEKSVHFTCGSNISSLSFMCLNFWKFENCHEIAWNFARMIESVSVAEKLKLDYPAQILVLL